MSVLGVMHCAKRRLASFYHKFPVSLVCHGAHRQAALQLCLTNVRQMFISEHLMDEFKWEKQELRRMESHC